MKKICFLIYATLFLGVFSVTAEAAIVEMESDVGIEFVGENEPEPSRPPEPNRPKRENPGKKIITLPQTDEVSNYWLSIAGGITLLCVSLVFVVKSKEEVQQ